ncbi:MAG: SLC13 family permease [Deinococcales bacterium]
MFDIVISLAVMLLCLLALVFSQLAAEIVMMAGLSILLFSGVLSSSQAFAGFANEGMLTVAVLYVVVAGLQDTGAVNWLGSYLFGRPKGLRSAQMRLMLPIAALSTFLNNTPLVAMMIPAVGDWAKKYQIAPSKLMIPLSYAAIFGGTCSLIGTSTNLVVNGLLLDRPDMRGLAFFEIAKVGLPCALIGIFFVIVASPWLLPKRQAVLSRFDDLRNYYSEMVVEAGALVGKNIEAAGLRHLPNAFLAEIEREGQILAAISPQEILQAGDILRFVGVVDSMVDLRKIRGLKPAGDQIHKLNAQADQRSLIEVVVSDSCPLLGKSIREGEFRSVYQAVVIAASRNGQQLKQKIGDIVLQAGDNLLLEALPSFVNQQKYSRDFYLVSLVEDSNPPRHDKAPIALAILLLMIILATFNILPMLQAALLTAGLMLLTGVTAAQGLLKRLDWSVLIVIAASFALGRGLEQSGAAQLIASNLTQLAQGHPWLSLAVIYGVTMLFTELITNNAAAVLIFPIAQATAQNLGVDFMPFAIVIMMAASASFATPIGYQTNLMVMGPGGYRFSDYFRIGIPLNLLMWLVTVLLVPLFWPF